MGDRGRESYSLYVSLDLNIVNDIISFRIVKDKQDTKHEKIHNRQVEITEVYTNIQLYIDDFGNVDDEKDMYMNMKYKYYDQYTLSHAKKDKGKIFLKL